MTTFRHIPDFDHRSFRASDFFTRLAKQPPDPFKQPHECDEFIIRGPEIRFNDGRGERSLGFADFRPSVLRQLAIDELDMVPRGALESAEEATDKLAGMAKQKSAELYNARDSLQAALLSNQELREALAAAEQALTEREADLQAALARAEAAEAAPKRATKARSGA